jgi:uncharacterized protein
MESAIPKPPEEIDVIDVLDSRLGQVVDEGSTQVGSSIDGETLDETVPEEGRSTIDSPRVVGHMDPVDPRLLEILVCPLTKTSLTYDRANGRLMSEAAGLAYPIVNGIPLMLIDEAEVIDDTKARKFREALIFNNPGADNF